jgi:hypothetical protein
VVFTKNELTVSYQIKKDNQAGHAISIADGKFISDFIIKCWRVQTTCKPDSRCRWWDNIASCRCKVGGCKLVSSGSGSEQVADSGDYVIKLRVPYSLTGAYSPGWTLGLPFRGFLITHTHIQTHGRTPLDELSALRRGLYLHRTTQHRNTRDKHPCPQRYSKPRPQQPSGRRPTP